MAFGLPIIATPVHGLTKQCVEGANALFYAKGKVEDIAGKIESLVNDETLRKHMGRSSLRCLSKLKTFEEMTDAYASVLRQAAKKIISASKFKRDPHGNPSPAPPGRTQSLLANNIPISYFYACFNSCSRHNRRKYLLRKPSNQILPPADGE